VLKQLHHQVLLNQEDLLDQEQAFQSLNIKLFANVELMLDIKLKVSVRVRISNYLSRLRSNLVQVNHKPEGLIYDNVESHRWPDH